MHLIRAIKFIIAMILAFLYWPLNASFLWLQGHYRKWQTEDRISFFIATPLYYFFFVIVAIFSIPLEILGDRHLHPPLPRMR